MTQKTGALIFDETADRYDIRFDVNDYYGGLHCGDCMEVFVRGKRQKPEDRFLLQNTPKPSKKKRNRQNRRKSPLFGRSLKQRKNRHRRNRQDRKHRIWKGADL